MLMYFVERFQMGFLQGNEIILCKLPNSCAYSSVYLNKIIFNECIHIALPVYKAGSISQSSLCVHNKC